MKRSIKHIEDYKQLLKETKKVYYRDLFDSRTNSVKQLWNNLNHIISLGKNKGTNTTTALYSHISPYLI